MRVLPSLFEHLRPTRPPGELRGVVLAGVRDRAVAGSFAPTIWTNLLHNRPVRWLWSASVVVLVVANLALGFSSPQRRADGRVAGRGLAETRDFRVNSVAFGQASSEAAAGWLDELLDEPKASLLERSFR